MWLDTGSQSLKGTKVWFDTGISVAEVIEIWLDTGTEVTLVFKKLVVSTSIRTNLQETLLISGSNFDLPGTPQSIRPLPEDTLQISGSIFALPFVPGENVVNARDTLILLGSLFVLPGSNYNIMADSNLTITGTRFNIAEIPIAESTLNLSGSNFELPDIPEYNAESNLTIGGSDFELPGENRIGTESDLSIRGTSFILLLPVNILPESNLDIGGSEFHPGDFIAARASDILQITGTRFKLIPPTILNPESILSVSGTDFELPKINRPPIWGTIPLVILSEQGDNETIDLDDYASDPDGDDLSYRIIRTFSGVSVTLSGSRLKVTRTLSNSRPFKSGTVRVEADDGIDDAETGITVWLSFVPE